MTTKEMIEIMQAYADGKQIEVYNYYKNTWEVDINPNWNWFDFDYRIKPDEPKFKINDWVVFKNQEIHNCIYKISNIYEGGQLQYNYSYGGGVCNPSDIKLWKPTEGELVVCNYRSGRCIVEQYDPNDTDYYTIQPLIYDFTIYK